MGHTSMANNFNSLIRNICNKMNLLNATAINLVIIISFFPFRVTFPDKKL